MQVYGLKFHNFFRFGETNNSVVFDISPENQELLDSGKLTLDEIYEQLRKNPIAYVAQAKKRGLTNLIGIAGVMGDNYDFSNGVGKSTILEGICYAHYEQVVRRNVNTDKIATAGLSVVTKINGKYPVGIKESWVEEIFEEGDKLYRIKRGRSLSGSHQQNHTAIHEFLCYNDGEPDDSEAGHRKGDTNESIAKVTPMEYETFVNSVMFGQSDAGKFLMGTDKTRKDMLVSLLKLEGVIANCLENIRRRKNAKDKEITTLNAQIDIVDGNLKAREPVAAIEKRMADLGLKIKEEEEKIKRSNDEIEKLSKSDLIKTVDSIKEEGKKVKDSLATLKETKESQVKEWRDLYVECEAKVKTQMDKMEAIAAKRKAIDNQITALENDIKGFDLATREEELKKVEKAKEVKPKIVEAITTLQAEKDKVISSIAYNQTCRNQFDNEIHRLNLQLKKVQGDEFICDKCGSKVDRKHVMKEVEDHDKNCKTHVDNLVKLETQKAEIVDKLTRTQTNLNKANDYLIKENKIKGEIRDNENKKQKLEETKKLQTEDYGKMHSDIETEYNALKKQKEDYRIKGETVAQKYDGDIKTLQAKLDELAAKYTSAKKNAEDLEGKIKTLRDNITESTKDKSDFDSQVGACRKDIETVQKETIKLEQLKFEHDDKRAVFNRLTLLDEVFGLDGIQTRIVKKYLPLLNIYIKEVMDILSDGDMRVEVCINEKSKVDIVIAGGMADNFTMISGGEKMLVRLAVDIGLALLSFTRCAQKPEIICLDEIFDPLDAYHTQAVFKLINKLQDKFNRVLVISHKADINKIIKHQILIEKGTGMFGMSKVRKIT